MGQHLRQPHTEIACMLEKGCVTSRLSRCWKTIHLEAAALLVSWILFSNPCGENIHFPSHTGEFHRKLFRHDRTTAQDRKIFMGDDGQTPREVRFRPNQVCSHHPRRIASTICCRSASPTQYPIGMQIISRVNSSTPGKGVRNSRNIVWLSFLA